MAERKVLYELSGKVFGNIKVLKRDVDNKKHGTIYICKCLKCGKIFTKDSKNIRNSLNYSCGCERFFKDITNQRFGNLVAIKCVGATSHKEKKWECMCDCGNVCYKTYNQLVKGHSTNCKKCGNKRAGIKNSKKPKFSKKLYECYVNMKTRTTNKKQDKNNRYINRNIRICDEWKNDYYSFEKWALENGYAENLTIDRIDNNGDYEPSNCRWVDRTIQANNRRTNVRLEYKGQIKTMAEWSKELNIPYWKLQRYRKKYSIEEIIKKK